MTNNVTFTGINNIYVATRRFRNNEYETLIPAGMRVKRDVVVRLRAALTDDASGQDLNDFKKLIQKIKTFSDRKYVNEINPEDVCLDVQYAVTEDRSGVENAISGFVLNGTEIPLERNEDLHLFTYIAKFTRRLAKFVTPKSDKETLANYTNDIIHQTALTYLER